MLKNSFLYKFFFGSRPGNFKQADNFRIEVLLGQVLIFILLFITIPVLADEAKDPIAESGKKQADSSGNTFIFRLGKLNATAILPEMQEIEYYTELAGLPYSISIPVSDAAIKYPATLIDFEYRIQDKFRLFVDFIYSGGKSNSTYLDKGIQPLDFGGSIGTIGSGITMHNITATDSKSKIGFGYFHPLINNLKFGIMLKNYKYAYRLSNSIMFSDNMTVSSIPITLQAMGLKEDIKNNYSGLVPLLALEYKPLSWLEISYNLGFINLSGTGKYIQDGLFGMANVKGGGSSVPLSFRYYYQANPDVSLKAASHDVAFKFKTTEHTRLVAGYSMELGYKKINSVLYTGIPMNSATAAYMENMIYTSKRFAYQISGVYFKIEFLID